MEEKELQFDKIVLKLLSIVAISFVLGLIFDYFFYKSLLGISVLIYVSFVLIGLLIISIIFKKRLNKSIISLVTPLLFFSAMVFIRSSVLLTFLNIVISIFLLLMIANLDIGQKIKNYIIVNYLKILIVPFLFIGEFIIYLFDAIKLWGIVKKQKLLHRIIRGLLITIPILTVFILLFYSADLVFRKYISNIINIKLETILRLIIVIFITSIFIGAYAYIFRRSNRLLQNIKLDILSIKKPFSFGIIETSILLGSINLLFLIFIFVQLMYLFGGEKTIAFHGYTYSQYARRGFFELIAVAVISFFIILLTEKFIFRKKTGHTIQFKILSGLLIVLVILIMVSAFKRLLLYENAYGFTVLRLYSHLFIIWLAVIFILLLYKIFINRRENIFVLCTFVSIIIFLVFINLANPDAFIANQNIKHYYKTGKLDVFYLTQLSEDAIPVTIKVLNIKDEHLRGEFAIGMNWKRENILEHRNYYNKWQSFNLSRTRAIQILESKSKELKELSNSCIDYINSTNNNSYNLPCDSYD